MAIERLNLGYIQVKSTKTIIDVCFSFESETIEILHSRIKLKRKCEFVLVLALDRSVKMQLCNKNNSPFLFGLSYLYNSF